MAGAKNITVIPARKRVGNTATADNKPKLKVAAYCRVSTDSNKLLVVSTIFRCTKIFINITKCSIVLGAVY